MMALLTQQHRVSGSDVPLGWEHWVKHDAFTYTAHRVLGSDVPLGWEHWVKHDAFTYTATQGIGQ